jgi:hypothetical protein
MSDTTKKDWKRYGEFRAGYHHTSACGRSQMTGKTFGCDSGPSHDGGHRGQAKDRRESMRIVRGKIRSHENGQLRREVNDLQKD